MKDLNLGLNDPANALTKQDANVAGGYVSLDSNKQMDASLIPLDYRRSYGYILDGVDDYIVVPHNDKMNFGIDDFSIEIFFKTKVAGVNKRTDLFAKHDAILSPYKGISVYLDNRAIVVRTTAEFFFVAYVLSQPVETIHLVITRSGNCWKSYVNGSFIATATEINPNTMSTIKPLIIGKSAVASDQNFILFRLFNRVLSGDDITYYWHFGRPDLQRLKPYDKGYLPIPTVLVNETLPFTQNSQGSGTSVLMLDEQEPYYRATAVLDKLLSVYLRIQIPVFGWVYTYMYIRQNSGSDINVNLYNDNTDYVSFTLKSGVWTKVYHRSRNEKINISYISIACKSANVALDYKNTYSINTGCILELLPENAQSSIWLESQNGLHATAFGNPAINMDSPSTTSQLIDTFNVDIAVGKFNRDLTLPSGWQITDIVVKSSTPLLNVQCQLDGVSLFNNKSVNGIKSFTISESSVYNTDKIIRFNAAGNGGDGMTIIVNIKKI